MEMLSSSMEGSEVETGSQEAEDFSHFSGVHQHVRLLLRKRSHRRLHDIQVEPLGWMQLHVTPQKLSWDQSIVDTL